MSPARGGRSRRGPVKAAKSGGARGAKKGAKAAGSKPAEGAKTPGARAPKPSGSRGAGGVSRAKGVAARTGKSSNARVVWPPQERTDTARDAIEEMMREAGLARRFEAQVEREASRAAEHAWGKAEAEVQEGQRRDLRELPTFTVDPATARDFDDAISAEMMEPTHPSDLTHPAVRVWVHIADVAAHIRSGSLVDLEARRRATSVYVPGAVEPMLPHALSSDACSLVPGAERLTVTVELVLRGAKVESASFCRSIIRSDIRLNYEQVDAIFAGEARASEPWAGPLKTARSAAAELQHARESSGALLIDSEEPEFSFDEHGNVSSIRPRAQTESHRVIEHLMILANEAVARQLTQASVPCLYRVHERPDPERIRKLIAQLASLGVATPPLPDPLFPAQAGELVGEISKRVDAHVRRTGQGRIALSSLVLRSLKQACYSPKNLGHAGLHSSCYCHFTSPIRRYPDLVCHRALLASIGAGERGVKHGAAKLVELGEWTSERERDAAKLEHKGDDIASCFLLERVLLDGGHEQVFSGEVCGLIRAGAFIAFGSHPKDRPIFEGMLPVRMLSSGEERDWWELNEQGTVLCGERSGAMLRLGDPIDVRVVRVDVSSGRVDLAPAS